jgi:hypothetical protein
VKDRQTMIHLIDFLGFPLIVRLDFSFGECLNDNTLTSPCASLLSLSVPTRDTLLELEESLPKLNMIGY